MEKILEVKGLEKSFNLHLLGEKVIEGCTDIDFTLTKGQFLGIYGPSGAGKSTVLKCIYRTYLPSEGQMIYNSDKFGEIDIAAASEQEILELRDYEINYLTQFLKVIPRVSAEDIVAKSLVKRGVDYQSALESARELLAKLEIPEELWDAYPSTFSGGEKQRINIARNIITKPKLLLLDEPTASLNRELKKLVLDLLWQLKKEGTTMVGIFHNLEFMREIADYQLSMLDGTVTALEQERLAAN